MLYVQFSDSGQTVIVSYFAGPQDAETYPNQGTVETNDARWVAFYNSMSEGVQASLPAPTGAAR